MIGPREGHRMAVGSLPLADAQAAVRFQCQAFPEIPAWPQLPKRSVRERITLQGLSGLPGIHMKPDGHAVVQEPPKGWKALADHLAEERSRGRWDAAALTPDDAAGFFAFLREARAFLKPETQAVKGQCAGPVTLGMALRQSDGKPFLANPDAMDALVEYLSTHALWQARALGELGFPVVFFLDEPSRGGWEPARAGIPDDQVRAWTDRILEPLQDAGVLTGLHVCGKGPFAWALGSSAEMIHLDGHRYLDALGAEAEPLAAFLRQGGWLSLGLVPTAMSGGSFPEAVGLVDRWMGFAHQLSKKGVALEALRSHSAFSTSCGLGAGTQAVAEEAARCLSNLVSLWKISARVGLPS